MGGDLAVAIGGAMVGPTVGGALAVAMWGATMRGALAVAIGGATRVARHLEKLGMGKVSKKEEHLFCALAYK